jgi:hypothetical protein
LSLTTTLPTPLYASRLHHLDIFLDNSASVAPGQPTGAASRQRQRVFAAGATTDATVNRAEPTVPDIDQEAFAEPPQRRAPPARREEATVVTREVSDSNPRHGGIPVKFLVSTPSPPPTPRIRRQS